MWTVEYSSDTELQDVGTIRATWSNVETNELLVFEKRVDSTNRLDEFVQDAKNALKEYQSSRTHLSEIVAKITAALNGN